MQEWYSFFQRNVIFHPLRDCVIVLIISDRIDSGCGKAQLRSITVSGGRGGVKYNLITSEN